jgi:hypothetical protein
MCSHFRCVCLELAQLILASKMLRSSFFQRTPQIRAKNRRFRLYWYRGVTVLLPGWVIWKYWNYPCTFFSLTSWLVSALSPPNGGEGYNSSTDFNPNTISHQYSSNPTSSRQNHKKNPNRNVVCINLPFINLHTVSLYEINIQKEWHWPPNI